LRRDNAPNESAFQNPRVAPAPYTKRLPAAQATMDGSESEDERID
jgi:hypothetical protein